MLGPVIGCAAFFGGAPGCVRGAPCAAADIPKAAAPNAPDIRLRREKERASEGG